MREISIEYRGSLLEITGDILQAYSSGGYEEESMMIGFETTDVYAGGVEITDLLTEEQMTDLDILAVEYLNEL